MAKTTKTPTAKQSTADEQNVFNKKAKALFAEYPSASEMFFTVDGLAFFMECDAKNHAVSLKDGTVTTIKKQ